MGQAIAAIVEQQDDLELAGLWDRGGDLEALVSEADVVVDFSLPAGSEKVLDAVLRHGKPLVCGVSGLTDEQFGNRKSDSHPHCQAKHAQRGAAGEAADAELHQVSAT